MKCSFPEITHIESEIKCPYCGKEQSDSWELLNDDGDTDEIDCDCGKRFLAEKCVTVDYRTSRNCALNNELHEYEQCRHSPQWEVCKKCGMNIIKEEPCKSVD